LESVGGGDDGCAEAGGHVCGELGEVGFDEGHAEVGEDGEFGLEGLDDGFGVGYGEVLDGGFGCLEDDVDDEDVGVVGVVCGEVGGVCGVADEADGVVVVFDGESVGFDAVVEWWCGGEGEGGVEGVGVGGLECGDGVDVVLGVFEDDGVGGECVGGEVEGAAGVVAAVGHGFDHDVGVVGVVEVSVGEDDGVEGGGVEVVAVALEEAAWSGVDE